MSAQHNHISWYLRLSKRLNQNLMPVLLMGVVVLLSGCLEQTPPAASASGMTAPPLTIEQSFKADSAHATATTFNVADYKGKVLAIDFWATWCGPCVASIPHLKTWHQQFSERGLHIIGYTDRSSKDLEAFITEQAIPYHIAVGPSISENDYGIKGIPHLVLIDHEGKIIKRGHPMAFSDADIEAALQKAGL